MATPPIETTSGLVSVKDGGSYMAGTPVAGSWVTLPGPVQKIDMYSPTRAGREPGKVATGAATEAVFAINTAP